MTMLRQKAAATLFALLFAGFGGFVLGHFSEIASDIEMQFWPHSSARTIVFHQRFEKVVCWTHQLDKYRPGPIQIWNYHLSDDLGNTEAFTPMRVKNASGIFDNPAELNTGEPPKTTEGLSVGNAQRTSFCADIPSWVKPGSTITIYGEVGYNGPLIPFTKIPMWMDYIEMPQISFYPNSSAAP